MKRALSIVAVIAITMIVASGCGESDPGPMGITGIDGGISQEGAEQEYVMGVQRALSQMASAQDETFSRAVGSGNAKALNASSIAWDQGVASLKQLDPPTDAQAAHKRLVNATSALSKWNRRIADAAPNKGATQRVYRTASESTASKLYGKAICQLVDAGYEVVDPGACGPFDDPGLEVG